MRGVMRDNKSDTAYKTISEVANVLQLQPHVLRFWESKFEQIQPLKRAGGRRFYRPEDVALIRGIRHLLHDKGLTIKGVKKIMREQNVAYVRRLGTEEGTEGGADAQPEKLAKMGENTAENLGHAQRKTLQAARQNLQQARILLLNKDD